jgi:hypothetical protein
MCNRQPVEAAHLRIGAISELDLKEAGSNKPHDALVVPLCATHHRLGKGAEHYIGTRVFWRGFGLEPAHVALRLYLAHRRIEDDMEAIEAMRSIVLEERFAAQT